MALRAQTAEVATQSPIKKVETKAPPPAAPAARTASRGLDEKKTKQKKEDERKTPRAERGGYRKRKLVLLG